MYRFASKYDRVWNTEEVSLILQNTLYHSGVVVKDMDVESNSIKVTFNGGVLNAVFVPFLSTEYLGVKMSASVKTNKGGGDVLNKEIAGDSLNPVLTGEMLSRLIVRSL
jgi:hypothetical protein